MYMKSVCFGVDIGGTSIKVGLFDDHGVLQSKWEFKTRKTLNDKEIMKDVADFIIERSRELKITKKDILGIGIGMPGPVLHNGEVLKMHNLGTGYFNIVEVLQNMTGCKVRAANDANMAALGEYTTRKDKGYKSMILVTLGTGIGGGIVINGSILPGGKGAAGEIGHIQVNSDETESCGCGRKGCLEQYASATGMVHLASRMLQDTTETSALQKLNVLTAKDILDCAKTGDTLALDVVKKACGYLGLVLSYVAYTINPEVIVIGGGVSKAGTILTDTIQSYYKHYVMDDIKDTVFELAVLGNDAGMYGAANLILEQNVLCTSNS